MTSVPKLFAELFELLGTLRDGGLTKEQVLRLDELLSSNSEILDYYIDYVQLCTELQKYAIANGDDKSKKKNLLAEMVEQDQKLLAERKAEEARQLAESKREKARRTAEAAFEKFKKEERRRQEKLAYKRYRVRQFRLVISVGALAACLVVVFSLWIHNTLTRQPAVVAAPVVATMVELQEAQWENLSVPFKEGTELTASKMKLVQGFAKIKLRKGAEVVLEAPAEITLQSENELFLRFGRLVAHVPAESYGFTVHTPASSMMDLGTQFGVNVHQCGTSELHVFKGEVVLFAGQDNKVSRPRKIVKGGQAKRVNIRGNILTDISLAENTFIHDMPSPYELALRKSQPVAYWQLGRESSHSINNVIGADHYPGVMVRGVERIKLASVFTKEQEKYALSFSGAVGQGVDFGNILPPGKDSFTVSLWFRLEDIHSSQIQYLARHYPATGSGGWRIFICGNTTYVRTSLLPGDNTKAWLVNRNSLMRRWHHIAMVINRDNNTMVAYLDGSTEGWGLQEKQDAALLEQSKRGESSMDNATSRDIPVKGNISSDTHLLLGCRSISDDTSLSLPLHGLVYDMGIWKRALRAEEIHSLYEDGPLREVK